MQARKLCFGKAGQMPALAQAGGQRTPRQRGPRGITAEADPQRLAIPAHAYGKQRACLQGYL
jgi:hypothetical protein